MWFKNLKNKNTAYKTRQNSNNSLLEEKIRKEKKWLHRSVLLNFGNHRSACSGEGSYKITSNKTSPFFIYIWRFKNSCLKLRVFHDWTESENNFCLPETQSEYDKIFFGNPQPDSFHPETNPYPRYWNPPFKNHSER